MKRTISVPLFSAFLGLSVLSGLSAQQMGHGMKANEDQEATLIKSALSAAPDFIAEGAAVFDMDNHQLRAGANGWTCFPDMPQTPGEDPMCVDAQWLEWVSAWRGRTEPHITGVGISYMLRGGWDASNTDPFATEPAPGEEWVVTGPHIMIVVPDPRILEGISTDPKNGGPYVMFGGTPYAHIMVPVAR